MAEKDGKRSWVMVNRAPVLTLCAAVVAEVLGFEHDEALTLGWAVAGLNAYAKGVSLGLFQPTPKEVQEQRRRILLRSSGRNFFIPFVRRVLHRLMLLVC